MEINHSFFCLNEKNDNFTQKPFFLHYYNGIYIFNKVGVLEMKRIDNYKNQLEKVVSESKDDEKLLLVFQEKMNLLNSYGEKKEFYDHFETLMKEKLLVKQ